MRLEVASLSPEPCYDEHVVCKAWRCTRMAVWRVWAERRCYDCAIKAGMVPGPVMRSGVQLEFRP